MDTLRGWTASRARGPHRRALRRSRRRHYLKEGDWVDSLYKAYVTAIVAGVALFYLTIALGSDQATAGTIATIEDHGAGVLGLAIALIVVLGLRSGARGGPLAPESADVMYLLLAPISRAEVLRGAAVRQLRGVVLVPAVAGALGGSIASDRLGGGRAGWIAAGAAFGVLVALAAWGAALIASGTRMSMAHADIAAVVLVAWSVVDVITTTATSPTAQIGRVALLPLTESAFAVAGVLVAVGAAIAGFLLVGGASLEALRRRARLVGELRFAATLQDMRSVIVLHRELAQDLPRSRPWWNARSARLGPCWQRDWRGLARWPAGRFLRVFTLAALAGLASVAVWNGTEAFVVVAGIAVFIAGIDAVEGLAQETDHPVRPEQYPLAWGDLVLSHLLVPACALVLTGVIGLVVFGVVAGTTDALTVAAIMLVPVALGGVAGAAVSVVAGAPPPSLFLDFGFPEFAPLILFARQVIAPALVITGFVPLVFAHDALTSGDSPSGAAFSAIILPLGVVGAASIWLRSRKQVVR